MSQVVLVPVLPGIDGAAFSWEAVQPQMKTEALGVLRGQQTQLQTFFTDIILSIWAHLCKSVEKTRSTFGRNSGKTTAVAKQHLNKTCFLHFNKSTFRHNGKNPKDCNACSQESPVHRVLHSLHDPDGSRLSETLRHFVILTLRSK